MPSDSVVGFLDRAQANRVLFPEQVEQLIRQPDLPHSNLAAFCDYLLSRGVLTSYQALAIREARTQELTVAGYPLIDQLGPCPGGFAYKALHPSLRTPLVLRRIKKQWLEPSDQVSSYIERARSYGMLIHPHNVPVLDVGSFQDEVYVVIDQPADAANLERLFQEVGGAMPGFLAAEYGRAIASVLRLVHERGGVHGEICPRNLLVTPLTTKIGPDGQERKRPAPNATVRLMELGLVPHRPAARQSPLPLDSAPFLAPERLDTATPSPRGDVYALGATLYFLLAGRTPFEGSDASEILSRVHSTEPASLAALRPDLPAELVTLVKQMMDKNPERRISTAAEVELALARYCRGNPEATTTRIGSPDPEKRRAAQASVADEVKVVRSAAAETNHSVEEPANSWDASAEAFSSVHASAAPTPRKRTMTTQEKKRSRMLLILGAILHLTWISLVILWVAGAFSSTPQPDPTPAPAKTEHAPPAKKNKKLNSTS